MLQHPQRSEYLPTDDACTDRKAATVIGSEKARRLQRVVWKEVVGELRANVPGLEEGLEAL